MSEIDENKAVRIKKLDALKAQGIDAYAQRFIRTHSVAEILKDFKEGVHVVTAGRIMANRDQGKVHFMSEGTMRNCWTAISLWQDCLCGARMLG